MVDTNKLFKSARKALQVKKDLRVEIDELKIKVRSAYTLEVQVNVAEYQPTPEEAELIKERAFNMKLLEKLESIYYTNRDHKKGDMVGNVYKENMSLLHFFYLVRLAQQGFFYTISAAYPDLEPEALIYFCDKLVTASLYAERLSDPLEKKAYRTITYDLMRNLVEEKDIPIAEGFKTTYKQIMDITQDLIYKSINPSEEVVDDESSQSKKSAPTSIPPVWVVMPYNGLMDNRTFALPGAVPSLPFPTHMLPALNTSTVGFPNALEDLKKDVAKKEKSIKRWERLHENKNVKDESKVDESKENEVKEDKKENESKEQVTRNNQDEEEDDEDEDEEEYEHDEDYERDRFADADATDSEDENNSINDGTDKKPVEVTKEVARQDPIKNDVILEKPTPLVTIQNIDKQKSEEPDKAISSWINFAASSLSGDTSKDRI
ncbi:hypothetical protein BDF21DRAFT_417327 [Thamnidium elegans]|nr:hypothetical protein BDF21DRAFT_417327 [Thamnidium elegans]